ncbi:hypothetical protein HM1_1879 [Heliomicrobium modesticaldum Ice1]|uniref:Uncharacterized protein n=1 Tax=Heliobacterium modesticaldum (strain ATCC 51547 / Ice1) TaxID=498761 RepID=B0TFC0_HELMI|nr:hypothetical protein HM1_1879 [Heliomicrobium modesticaldum Ice1]
MSEKFYEMMIEQMNQSQNPQAVRSGTDDAADTTPEKSGR